MSSGNRALAISPSALPTGRAVAELDHELPGALRIRELRIFLLDRDGVGEPADEHTQLAFVSRVARGEMLPVVGVRTAAMVIGDRVILDPVSPPYGFRDKTLEQQ
ncbi:hypothetical protein JIX56_27120 [Streptomyces sp. CA-210063]|uniref:hypothetical protein n=1 Tax=Streptomyces sp. CA-210063 TaxID=2801029 RepID=UPI00214B9392|nr:hypothetical protein [Streptomyces sp. CA-210063]UUU33240.1 hypothetical protein JIX56_27120 [Streptomyces sp. CA-210063]